MIKMFKENFDRGAEKGNFAIKFENGFTVSLAMGDGMYSTGTFSGGFASVEVAAWDANGDWVPLVEGENVEGWVSPNGVLEIMNRVAAMQPIDSQGKEN